MFNRLSKHLKIRQKYSAERRIFNSLLGVWISRWNTVSRVWYITYNWCDTDLKKQSPVPPTSIDCKPSSPNLDCIKSSEEIGEVNCIVELWFCIRANPHKNQTKSNFFGKAWKLNFTPLLHIASPYQEYRLCFFPRNSFVFPRKTAFSIYPLDLV